MRYSRIILLGLLGLWAVLGVVAVSAVAVHPGIGPGPRTAFGSASQASDMREQSKTSVYLEGTITEGVYCGCHFLRIGLETYDLDGDLDGFTCGDRVGVWGTLCPTCLSICMEGTVFVVEAIVGLPADSDGDTVLDSADNCPDIANPGQGNDVHPGTPEGDHCEDPDLDVVFDVADNCPDTANAGQENSDGDQWGNACENCPSVATVWWVLVGDGDCDAFTDADEGSIGTDPADNCPDDPADDAWPCDFDMSTVIDLADLFNVLPPHFGSSPSIPDTNGDGIIDWSPRRDLVPNGVINLGDVFRVLPPYFGYVCE